MRAKEFTSATDEAEVHAAIGPEASLKVVKRNDGEIRYEIYAPYTAGGKSWLMAMGNEFAETLARATLKYNRFKDDPSVTQIMEGGWVDTRTQGTHITPALVEKIVTFLHEFETKFNQYLAANTKLPAIQMGNPCGSTTYYKKDLAQDPTREYGDVDVNLHLPPLRMPNAQRLALYKQSIRDFCASQPDLDSESGGNLIAKIDGQYVQIDLVMSDISSREWVKALAPEWKVKGVLSGSLYAAFAQALLLSFGGTGIQAKTAQGKLVPFRQSKGTTLVNVSSRPDMWAVDVANFFGARVHTQELMKHPGLKDEQRVFDIAQSIRGVADTLEQNGKLNNDVLPYKNAESLLREIARIYVEKINTVINSSKFDKAATPEAQEKAAKTKGGGR